MSLTRVNMRHAHCRIPKLPEVQVLSAWLRPRSCTSPEAFEYRSYAVRSNPEVARSRSRQIPKLCVSAESRICTNAEAALSPDPEVVQFPRPRVTEASTTPKPREAEEQRSYTVRIRPGSQGSAALAGPGCRNACSFYTHFC
eukprot:gene15145-biopygen6249